MQIEITTELAEEIYWAVLKQFKVDYIGGGYIELEDDGSLGFSKNTEKGQQLYFTIEALIENYMGVL